MGMRNDSCMTYLDAVVSRQPGGGRCCSSGMSHGFSKEASRCRIEARLDVGFHHPGLSSELELDGQCIHRIQGAYLGPIPIATAQEVLRVDGCQEARSCQWSELVFYGGDAQRALRAIPFGHILASDEFGAVPLLLQALHEVVDVLVPGLLIGVGTHLIHPGGGILAEVAPALLQERLVEHPREVAEPIALLTFCLLRSSLQGGGHWGPIL